MIPDDAPTYDTRRRYPESPDERVIRAAIQWHVHHSPLTGPHDRSMRAVQARAEMRTQSEIELHAAVAALTERAGA